MAGKDEKIDHIFDGDFISENARLARARFSENLDRRIKGADPDKRAQAIKFAEITKQLDEKRIPERILRSLIATFLTDIEKNLSVNYIRVHDRLIFNQAIEQLIESSKDETDLPKLNRKNAHAYFEKLIEAALDTLENTVRPFLTAKGIKHTKEQATAGFTNFKSNDRALGEYIGYKQALRPPEPGRGK